MTVIVRIVSADGKKVVSKTLPGVPAKLKVPAGAHVEVVNKDSGEVMPLPRYVNDHSDEAGRAHNGGAQSVEVVQAGSWGEAEAALESAAGMSADEGSAAWFGPVGEQNQGDFLGIDHTTLLIGGVVGAGLLAGGYSLLHDNGPKDKTPPAAPTGLKLKATDDLGSSNSDNVTSKTSGLTITGTSEAGAKVAIYDGDTKLTTVTADASGNFSFTTDLAVGVHQIRAVATDEAGNTGAASSPLVITIDTVVPAAPTGLDLATVDDLGASSTDNITSKTSGLTFTGSGEVGATVTLYDGATALGTVVIGSTGTYALDVSLTEGTHAITATQTDKAGNVSPAGSPLTVVIDTTPPATPAGLDLAAADDNGSSNTDNVTSQTTQLTISGMGTAGSTVELFDAAQSLGKVIVDASGHFAIDIDLAIGAHPIRAKAYDVAGNASTLTAALDITVVDPGSSLLHPTLLNSALT